MSILAMVTYKGETLVFDLKPEDGYAVMLQKVSSRWALLKEGCFCLFYSFRNKPRCILGSEDDFGCLISLIKLYSVECVDFEVIDNSGRDYSGFCQSDVASCSSFVSEDVGQCYDSLASFCKHDNKELLSVGCERLISAVGHRFDGGAPEFRVCLRKFCVASGHDFKFSKNFGGRVKAVCALKEETGCSWMVSASKDESDGSFHLRKFVNVHTCYGSQVSFKNRNMTSNVVAKLIEEDVRGKGRVRPVDVVQNMASHFGVSISYSNALRSVGKAKRSVHGSDGETFEFLNWYVDSIIETNPGSHVILDVEQTSLRFRRIFVAFDGCIKGFFHCRPLLFLDGTHLKGVYKGHLLSAVAKDGNHGLYPLCFAVVDSENRSNWEWFLENLKMIVDANWVITFISDRNLGLMECLPRVFPSCFHCYCLDHLKKNLRDRLGSRFRKVTKERLIYLFEKCAYAPTVACFDEKIEEFLRDGGSLVGDFLTNLPPEKWSNAHFKGKRYGCICSTAVESFNNWMLRERELPVGGLIDTLHLKLTKQVSDRSCFAEHWNEDLCVEINRRLSDTFKKWSFWSIIGSGPGIYEVQSSPSVMVDLLKQFCSCFGWQLTGLPCAHAVVCIIKSGQRLSSFVDPWFHSSTYKKCYSSHIHLVPTVWKPKSMPEDKRVLAPYSRRPPGRPKSKRIRSRGELVSVIRCGRCGREGHHNSRSCKAPLMM